MAIIPRFKSNLKVKNVDKDRLTRRCGDVPALFRGGEGVPGGGRVAYSWKACYLCGLDDLIKAPRSSPEPLPACQLVPPSGTSYRRGENFEAETCVAEWMEWQPSLWVRTGCRWIL